MKKTIQGLPNTCSKCGKLVEDVWFAKNDDVALAGGGICVKCHEKASPPEPTVTEKKSKKEKPNEPNA